MGDILAYRRFVNTSWDSLSASAVLVAFHNTVTDSVSSQFQEGTRKSQYCLKDVVKALPQAISDLAEGIDQRPPAISVDGIRGLGSHKEVHCA